MAGRADAALATLAGLPDVDANRHAAIGFCQGGVIALELARHRAPIRAAIGFHPSFIRPAGSVDGPISAKILMLVGAADPLVAKTDLDDFAAAMTAAGADWQLYLFGGIGHSYTNPAVDAFALPGFACDPQAERRAWSMMPNCPANASIGPICAGRVLEQKIAGGYSAASAKGWTRTLGARRRR